MPKTSPRSIRLKAVLLDHLNHMAERENRSINNLIETILQEYVEEYELLATPEFRKAIKNAETDDGIPWRKGMKVV